MKLKLTTWIGKLSFGFVIICLITLLTSNSKAQENEQKERQFEITTYKIWAKIPDSYNRIDVRALLNIKTLFVESQNDLNIILCKDFIGVTPINIRISDEKESPLDFTQKDEIVTIKLPDKYYRKRIGKILVTYSLKNNKEYDTDQYSRFAFEVSDTLCHINAAITRTDNWYPKLAGHLNDRLPEFHLVLNVPSKFDVMASGKLRDVESNGTRKTYTWQNYPEITDRSLYFFVTEQKRIVKTYPDGFRIVMYIPEDAIEENLQYISDVIHKSFCFFESRFGKVAGNEYKIMAFPYGYSGLYRSMTAPMILFTAKIVNNDIYYPTRTLIHEVSHTWWGNVVSANAEEDYWLFEGLAKYSEIIGIKPAVGADVETLSFYRLKLSTLPYLDYVPSIKEAGKEEDQYLKTVAAYYQGATFLNMLESVMGKEMFFRFLKDYVCTYQNRCANTDDFLGVLRNHASEEIVQLARDHLYHPGYATYSVMRVDTECRGNAYPHLFIVRNTGDKIIFSKIHVKSDLEGTTRTLLLKKGQRVDFEIMSRKASGPVSLTVDPEGIYPVWKSGLKSPGGMVYRNAGGDVVFFNVITNSILARAGIKNGMVLLDVNGDNLQNKDLEGLNALFLQSPGTRLRCLVRDSEDNQIPITIIY